MNLPPHTVNSLLSLKERLLLSTPADESDLNLGTDAPAAPQQQAGNQTVGRARHRGERLQQWMREINERASKL